MKREKACGKQRTGVEIALEHVSPIETPSGDIKLRKPTKRTSGELDSERKQTAERSEKIK